MVTAGDGEAALLQYERSDPDLVVLDVMLPKMNGFDVRRELRRRGDTPILMLTARSEDVDAIVGIERVHPAQAAAPGSVWQSSGNSPVPTAVRPGRRTWPRTGHASRS